MQPARAARSAGSRSTSTRASAGSPRSRSRPSARQTQWYFQRYISHLPSAGEIVLFDRSWYNRAGVETVMGFCTPEEHARFLRQTPTFERMLVEDGIILLKYWFSVSDEEQERRFQSRTDDPMRRWKLSPMDLASRQHWVEFSRAKDEMFVHTDIPEARWFVVEGDNKQRRAAQLHPPSPDPDPVRGPDTAGARAPAAPAGPGLRAAVARHLRARPRLRGNPPLSHYGLAP